MVGRTGKNIALSTSSARAKAKRRAEAKVGKARPAKRTLALPTISPKTAAQECVPACASCGYRFTHLHAGQCPLCKPCPRCQMRVRHCVCKEGE